MNPILRFIAKNSDMTTGFVVMPLAAIIIAVVDLEPFLTYYIFAGVVSAITIVVFITFDTIRKVVVEVDKGSENDHGH